jgi:capsid assembly protease
VRCKKRYTFARCGGAVQAAGIGCGKVPSNRYKRKVVNFKGDRMKSYPNVRRALAGKLWFIHENKAQELLAFFEFKLSGGVTAPDKLQSIRATNSAAVDRAQRNKGRGGAIVVIPIYGVLLQRPLADISGGSIGTSTTSISAALRQVVEDPGVGSIVLDIDSPGGDVSGIDELATEIYQARKQKRIVAVSNCLCASAAYYLAAQCSEIVVSPSSQTGSIGVYCVHEDDSAALEAAGIKLELIKYGANKAEGNNLGPLTDSAREHMQSMVDGYGIAFERAVARGRGITQSDVHSKFGQGRVFDAKTAVRIGMADRVGTLADVLSTPSLSTSVSGRQAQLASAPTKPALSTRRGRTESARMRHELLMASGGPVAKGYASAPTTAPKKRRAGDGDADDCGCDCVPCGGCDCDACDCDSCECEGCGCDSAQAKLKAKKARAAEFARMRHELAAARV